VIYASTCETCTTKCLLPIMKAVRLKSLVNGCATIGTVVFLANMNCRVGKLTKSRAELLTSWEAQKPAQQPLGGISPISYDVSWLPESHRVLQDTGNTRRCWCLLGACCCCYRFLIVERPHLCV